MLLSPPQYGGITAPTSTCHLRQDDAFVDSLPPAVANPSGGAAASQTALPCIAGSVSSPFPPVLVNEQRRDPLQTFPDTTQEFSVELNEHVNLYIENLYCIRIFTSCILFGCVLRVCVCLCIPAGFYVHSQTQEMHSNQVLHGGDVLSVADPCSSQVSCIFSEG